VDLIYAAADFERRSPREIYGDPRYVQALKEGYEASSGHGYEITERDQSLQAVVMYAREIRNWWEWGQLLHPRTPDFLKTLLDSLASLG
jgi:hypothetical protein